MSEQPHRAWSGAALAIATALTLVFPPDVHPESGAIAALLLALGLVSATPALRWGVLAVGATCAAIQLGWSFAPARTGATLLRLLLPLAALAVAATADARTRRWVLWSAAAAGAGLGLLALLQKWWLLPESAAWARETGAAAEILVRLASGRPFATHAVPAALAGALMLSLAAVAALACERDARWPALALGVPAAIGCILTASLGAFLAVVGVLVLLALRGARVLSARARWGLVLGAPLLLLLLIALRPVPVLDLSRADHPLRLRLGNWRAAVLIAPQQPALGTGLGSYGALMPSVRRAGDQQSLYAHNSWLQLAVEGGIPALVALIAGAVWLRRRARDELERADLWLWAGVAGFALHNLLDFTAYLPGVTTTAATMAGLLVAARRSAPAAGERSTAQTPASRRPAWLFAALLAGSAIPWGCEAAARRALDQPGAAGASDAARWAPWSMPIALRAGASLLSSSTGADDPRLEAAAALGRTLTRRDPASPAGWHLLGAARQLQRRLGESWLALEVAVSRHRGDQELLDSIHGIEELFRRGGMLAQPIDYGAAASPHRYPWQGWDDLVLLGTLAAAALLLLRRFAPESAPRDALLIALVALAVPWGEGGALPGARLARVLVLLAALLWSILPRVSQRDAPLALPLVPLAGLAPLLVVAVFAAALSPDPAGARDGMSAILTSSIALVLSWQLAFRFPSWPRIVVQLFGIAASASALLWLVQSAARALAPRFGLDLATWPVPLRVAEELRPAADFLHPGHLGTFLVAGGLAFTGTALFSRPGVRLPLGLALIACGLAGGARGSVLALLAGGLVLALLAARPALRRAIVIGMVVALIAGLAAVIWRFSAGDPYMWRRIEIWRAACGAIADRPWFGFGPGGFEALAASYRFLDPGPVAQFGRTFTGPHSDLLQLPLSLGIPGAIAALIGLGLLFARAVRTTRLAHAQEPALVGGLAALCALLAHGLADDLLSERPATALFAALLVGALAGGRLVRQRLWVPSLAARWSCVALLLAWAITAEAIPWAADRLLRSGQPLRAAQLDRQRAGFWLAAARDVEGEPLARLARALDRVTTATTLRPASNDTWKELAQLLDAACRGPLPEQAICRHAASAWDRALAAAPRDALARYGRARLADAVGDHTTAQEALEQALRDEPRFLSARLALAHLLLRSGDERAARAETARLSETIRALDGVRPESDYERELLRLDPASYRALRARFD